MSIDPDTLQNVRSPKGPVCSVCGVVSDSWPNISHERLKDMLEGTIPDGQEGHKLMFFRVLWATAKKIVLGQASWSQKVKVVHCGRVWPFSFVLTLILIERTFFHVFGGSGFAGTVLGPWRCFLAQSRVGSRDSSWAFSILAHCF